MVENFIVLNLLHVSMKLALIMYFWYVVVKIFLQFYDLWLEGTELNHLNVQFSISLTVIRSLEIWSILSPNNSNLPISKHSGSLVSKPLLI